MKNFFLALLLLLILPEFVSGQKIKLLTNSKEQQHYRSIQNPRRMLEDENTSVHLKVNNEKLSKYIKKDFHELRNEFSIVQVGYKLFISRTHKVDSAIIYLAEVKIPKDGEAITLNFNAPKKIINPSPELQKRLLTIFQKTIRDFKPFETRIEEYILGGEQYIYSTPAKKNKDYHQYLASLPDTTSKINLAEYGLVSLPKELYRFKNLKQLNLNDNNLEALKIKKAKFKNLHILSLQNNFLTEKKLKISKKHNLAILNLNRNYITSIPKKNGNTKSLLMASNFVSSLNNRSLKRIKRVQTLNLYDNALSTIEGNISRLQNLQELDVYRNSLISLPAEISTLTKLTQLAASYNNISVLPENLDKLPNLTTLYVHHNKIKQLPILPNTLELLDVGYNSISDISTPVTPLINIKSLDYSNNNVSGSLEFLFGLKNLEDLFFYNNSYATTEEEERYFAETYAKLLAKGIKAK